MLRGQEVDGDKENSGAQGPVPGASLSSFLSDLAQDPWPSAPFQGQVGGRQRWFLDASCLRACFPPGTEKLLRCSPQAHHTLQVPRVRRDPCEFLGAEERPPPPWHLGEQPQNWALLQCSAHPSCPHLGPPLPPAGPWAPFVLCSPPRIFPTCLGRVSLRPGDEQTEAEKSPKR